ncbi:MAG: chemotaxis response regulator protein-glutamate methylesterase [Planctomycetes bacterium]|nr:chemotaxis response regulator protein-glutamate methylesterase [Planctomycetota bacterium]
MNKVRVLVVDDSALFRKVLSDVINADADLVVAGTARDGRQCIEAIERVKPDIVTLDVEMPVMDGLEAIREIRARWTRLPVVMFSTLTEAGGAATIEALARGASDYVAKPARVANAAQSMERITGELIPKLRALCRLHVPRFTPSPQVMRAARVEARAAPSGGRGAAQGAIDLVAIGSSTGGPNALATVLSAIPRGFAAGIVITQHMPAIFTRLLAQRLAGQTAIAVEEACEGAPVRPGAALIAPGGHHMTVAREGTRRVVRLNVDPEENFCRPSVDVMLRSVAAACGRSTLAVILTGMGHDGMLGARAVRESGGGIFAQDEPTSVVWGMPGSVVAAGLADKVLPVERIAAEIVQRVAGGPRAASPSPVNA